MCLFLSVVIIKGEGMSVRIARQCCIESTDKPSAGRKMDVLLKYTIVFEAEMVDMPACWVSAAMLHTVPAAPCICFYHEIEYLELILVVPSLAVASHTHVPSLTTVT